VIEMVVEVTVVVTVAVVRDVNVTVVWLTLPQFGAEKATEAGAT